jgi:hypothetical protein
LALITIHRTEETLPNAKLGEMRRIALNHLISEGMKPADAERALKRQMTRVVSYSDDAPLALLSASGGLLSDTWSARTIGLYLAADILTADEQYAARTAAADKRHDVDEEEEDDVDTVDDSDSEGARDRESRDPQTVMRRAELQGIDQRRGVDPNAFRHAQRLARRQELSDDDVEQMQRKHDRLGNSI